MRIITTAITVCAALMFGTAPAIFADTLTIPASRDATLIENALGERANGAGPALFAGRTGQSTDGIRRALVYFDVAAALPPRAIILRVFPSLDLSPSNAAAVEVALHAVLEDWDEGRSFSAGGGGAPAEAGDVTWIHSSYPDRFWTLQGGHFVSSASATATVEGTGFYTWQSTPQLVADVTRWLHAPQRNHGWMLVGDELLPQSVKRFDSREAGNAALRPALTIEYRLPGPGEGLH